MSPITGDNFHIANDILTSQHPQDNKNNFLIYSTKSSYSHVRIPPDKNILIKSLIRGVLLSSNFRLKGIFWLKEKREYILYINIY